MILGTILDKLIEIIAAINTWFKSTFNANEVEWSTEQGRYSSLSNKIKTF